MSTDLRGLWDQLAAEANNKADQFGITDINQRNAFAHMYVSALLVQQYGELAAFIAGTGQELYNHWVYRNGGPEPQTDPNQRIDTFRDLWNNGVGREIGNVAVYNNWTNDQTAEYARNAISQGVAIVDRVTDSRIPSNLGQLSTFDYFLGSNGASVGEIYNIAPPGTNFPPQSVGGEFSDLQGIEYFVGDDGAVFTLQKNVDGTTTFSAVDQDNLSGLNELQQTYDADGELSRVNVSTDDGVVGTAELSDSSNTVTEFDPTNSESWTRQTTEFDAQDNERVIQSTFDDGSSLTNGFDENGNPIWTKSVDTDGNVTITDADGTVITADGGNVDPATAADSSPDITYGDPDGPKIRVTVDADGEAHVRLNDGTDFGSPAGGGISISPDGVSIAPGADPSAPYGFVPPSDPDGPGDPPLSDMGAPFAGNHPGPLQQKDPLVLDLDGNGVALTRVQDSTAHFDYGGTGFAPKTGWVGAGDGILVRDLNNDGAVTANELFGAVSGNGFNDLAALDSNADGKVAAGDAAFGELRVWQDADGDGIAGAGELSSLASTGIAAINLSRQQSVCFRKRIVA